MEGRS
jgi:hypothetical protein